MCIVRDAQPPIINTTSVILLC